MISANDFRSMYQSLWDEVQSDFNPEDPQVNDFLWAASLAIWRELIDPWSKMQGKARSARNDNMVSYFILPFNAPVNYQPGLGKSFLSKTQIHGQNPGEFSAIEDMEVSLDGKKWCQAKWLKQGTSMQKQLRFHAPTIGNPKYQIADSDQILILPAQSWIARGTYMRSPGRVDILAGAPIDFPEELITILALRTAAQAASAVRDEQAFNAFHAQIISLGI